MDFMQLDIHSVYTSPHVPKQCEGVCVRKEEKNQTAREALLPEVLYLA